MLLKLGMAELGNAGCTECVALVMCTVLNRVESQRFGSTIARVIHAPQQFTPVMTGAYSRAKPNDLCFDAYEMVVHGWDESQGALYYEFCQGESWHSNNLHLLFQHCNTRFYD
ncbi:MAG: cell wall hydrolase [Oscillospiraceae bacterium]|nr:cell wall hydrolase [Oscillospiraceae bacterium]